LIWAEPIFRGDRAAIESTEVVCIVDNTAEGAATANALDVLGRVSAESRSPG
jgi:hypothetical protein